MQIIIADSHCVCRTALQTYISHADDSLFVDTVGDYASLLEKIGLANPDLVLMDDHLPGLPSAVEDMAYDKDFPETRVGIMLASTKIIPSGMDGYGADIFPKSLSSKNFLEGIYKVLAGDRFVPDDAMMEKFPIEQAEPCFRSQDNLKLTQRERQVLSHLLKGSVNKDIARALDLQVVTVKLHVRGICRKMGVKNRTQAALLAKEYGWA